MTFAVVERALSLQERTVGVGDAGKVVVMTFGSLQGNLAGKTIGSGAGSGELTMGRGCGERVELNVR